MPNVRNRRAEAEARGLLKRAETMVARASHHLLNGDPLVAMRLLRAAAELNQLDSRLRIKREVERKALARLAEEEMKQRESAVQQRESMMEFRARDLERGQAALQKAEAEVAATYELMRTSTIDGPPPATETETVSGVAPL
jgi:hypothetical protein